MSTAQPLSTSHVLLLRGDEADPHPERGVACPGALHTPADPHLIDRAMAAKATLGDRVFVLGHHYQRDEIIQLADVTGDSFKLARDAAARPEAEFIVFCGVHFMAESADILTDNGQQVILPDLTAGCSMADMASLEQVEQCWETLATMGTGSIVPVTYMNSTAAIKSFVGKHGGIVCTSSNAEQVLRWAFDHGDMVLFLPDQHLGRNTAVRSMGLSLDDCVLYDPDLPHGGLDSAHIRDAKMILWRGHCCVHTRFSPSAVTQVRQSVPGIQVIVHPECRHEVVMAADQVGSTEYIIQQVDSSPPGTAWAIGTELSLVQRLSHRHPDKRIVFLDQTICYCSTMSRLDVPRLVMVLEDLVAGHISHRVVVDTETARYARIALDRMLTMP